MGVNVRVRICKERSSNENLLPVIFFSATQDFKKEHPRKNCYLKKLTERANFLLLQRLLYEKMVKNRWFIYGFLSKCQKQRESKFDHGLISLHGPKKMRRFALCKKKKMVVENDDYDDDN